MTILLVLIPLGLGLLAIAIAAFIWAVRHGQFEDLEGEGERILFDEDRPAALPGTPRATSDASGRRSGPGSANPSSSESGAQGGGDAP